MPASGYLSMQGKRLMAEAAIPTSGELQRIERVVSGLENEKSKWAAGHPTEYFHSIGVLKLDASTDARVVRALLFSAHQAGYTDCCIAAKTKNGVEKCLLVKHDPHVDWQAKAREHLWIAARTNGYAIGVGTEAGPSHPPAYPDGPSQAEFSNTRYKASEIGTVINAHVTQQKGLKSICLVFDDGLELHNLVTALDAAAASGISPVIVSTFLY